MNIDKYLTKLKINFKTLFTFRWNPTKDTFIGFIQMGVIFIISILLSYTINKSTILTIFVRDFLMLGGNIFFCLFYIQNNNYKFKDFGLTAEKWQIYLPINFILGIILLLLFIDEHHGAKLKFNLNTLLLIGYIMLSGIFEMIVFYSFLRRIFINTFGIITCILLA
ncbi:MAG: hypothetical protein HY934_04900 [Candidatus Firestonebacteria bacterium]|nr:hypothetical protein [Candidatus Firestonebacteria bacterium]